MSYVTLWPGKQMLHSVGLKPAVLRIILDKIVFFAKTLVDFRTSMLTTPSMREASSSLIESYPKKHLTASYCWTGKRNTCGASHGRKKKTQMKLFRGESKKRHMAQKRRFCLEMCEHSFAVSSSMAKSSTWLSHQICECCCNSICHSFSSPPLEKHGRHLASFDRLVFHFSAWTLTISIFELNCIQL